MPKYNVTMFFDSVTFELDTDEHKEDLTEAEVNPNDPDALHDWIRDLDNPLDYFGYYDQVELSTIHVEEKVEKKP